MLWLFAVLGNLGLSLSVAWIAYREMLSPEKLLDLGLLYEVAEALCLGIMFHSLSLRPDVDAARLDGRRRLDPRLPADRPEHAGGKTVVATVAAALMDPLGARR